MFGNNQQISNKQFFRLVVFDWIAKTGLLIPGLLNQSRGADGLLLFLGTGVSVFAYAWVVGTLACRIKGSFSGYLKERMGPYTTWIVTCIYLLSVLIHTVFLIRMFTAIAVEFILPEMPPEVLAALLILTGCYVAAGGLEVRARVTEILFCMVLYPLLLMLIAGAFSMNPDYLEPASATPGAIELRQSLQMFLPFGSMGLFLYIAPFLKRKQDMKRGLFRAAGVTIAVVSALLVVLIGSFGANGMRSAPWPVITLMSSVRLPGRFLQRWDVVFTALLLVTFFAAVGAGMFYLKFLTEELIGRKKKGTLLIAGLVVYLAVLLCGNYETACSVFLVVNGCLFVPILVFCSVFLWIIEKIVQEEEK